jgi:hypothetical protein
LADFCAVCCEALFARLNRIRGVVVSSPGRERWSGGFSSEQLLIVVGVVIIPGARWGKISIQFQRRGTPVHLRGRQPPLTWAIHIVLLAWAVHVASSTRAIHVIFLSWAICVIPTSLLIWPVHVMLACVRFRVDLACPSPRFHCLEEFKCVLWVSGVTFAYLPQVDRAHPAPACVAR